MKKIIADNKCSWRKYALTAVSGLLLSMICGCNNKFFDPTQVGRFKTTPTVNVILDSLGVYEESSIAWQAGEEPRAVDTEAVKTDYTFLPGDIIRISIFELLQEQTYFINDYIVKETGNISVPEVGVVQVTGISELQLEELLKQKLSPGILKSNPLVTVTLLNSQQRTFSILGDGISMPGEYPIIRQDLRLTEVLAMANGLRPGTQDKVSYIYVSRQEDSVVQNGQQTGQNTGSPLMNFNNTGNVNAGTVNTSRQRTTNTSQQENQQSRWPESTVVISSSDMIQPNNNNSSTDLFNIYRNSTAGRYASINPQTPQTTVDEPTDVQEVIRTLSERSGQNYSRTSNATTNTPQGQADISDSNAVDWQYINNQWVPFPINQAQAQPQAQQPQQPPQAQQQIQSQAQPQQQQPQAEEEADIIWEYINGRWTAIEVGPPEQAQEPTLPTQPSVQITEQPFSPVPGLTLTEQQEKTRLIKISTERLWGADPICNIIIKPGDTIFVPVDIIGSFYIMGNVNRTGEIPLTGQPMTLKQAIAAAGGLGPLAWPRRCEITRRISRNREEIVMVDLDKIFSGEQPDFFIKPNDMINVGTDATSRWRAILRNAFRATYGFGFVYDRNFAYEDFNSPLDWF